MSMTKIAGKCAAILCAMAVTAPAAAAAVPTVFTETAAITASADEYKSASITGDLYCAVGDTFTMTVGSGDAGDAYEYKWYYSTDKVTGTNVIESFTWMELPYTTQTISAKMTSALNGAHVRAEMINKSTGVIYRSPMRTLSANAIKTKLGAASVETYDDGTYVAVPFLATGFIDNKFTAMTLKLSYDGSVFEEADFESEVGGFGLDSNVSGEEGTYYKNSFYDMSNITVGSDNLIGTFYLKVKDGASYEGSALTLELTTCALTGDDYSGQIVYGSTPVSTTISTASKAENPTVTYVKGDGKVQLNWNAVDGIDGYGILGYQNGSWKLLSKVAKNKTSYVLSNLKAGTNYKVCVAVMQNGAWNTDTSKAIVVTPNAASTAAPTLTVQTTAAQFRCSWTKVSGATAYAVAVSATGKGGWTQLGSFSTSTTTYTSPAANTRKGTYYVAVAAKVGGKWNISNVEKVTITG